MNQILPEVTSVAINLNESPLNVAAGRKYMAGNMLPKSCKTKGLTTRRLTTGFEKQYGDHTRKIVSPANMTVMTTFYKRSVKNTGEPADDWAELHVVFFNEDLKKYDLLVLPKYHTQNFYVGFEYIYDKEMIRRIQPNATFKKGEVFAKSPGLAPTGELMFGMDTYVACMTLDSTEEDGVIATRSYLERLGVMFEHKRGFSYNDGEYIALNLYGDDENYQPFPENGQPVRPDGLVMAFRRRDGKTSLASMSNKSLRRVDLTFDKKIYAPPGSVVKSIVVKSERLKNRSHNKKPKPIQKHAELLERYANADNQMCNDVKSWYVKVKSKFKAEDDLPFTRELKQFIYQAYGNITNDFLTGKVNTTKRTHRNKQLQDWNIDIILKEEVSGKVRFKLSDLSGAEKFKH